METQFSDFNDYKKIRKIIRNFSEDETYNESFSSSVKKDSEEYYSLMNNLNKLLKDEAGITLNDFFNKFSDKIYNDPKFTDCCGFLDLLLYRYNKNHPLGGDMDVNPISKYNYGYQNSELGYSYIKQHFGSFKNFYKKIAEYIVKTLFINQEYYEIIEDIENCTLILTYRYAYSKQNETNLQFVVNGIKWSNYDNITFILVGDEKSMDDLIDEIDEGNIEDYINFEEIKKEILYQEDIKRLSL